MARTLPKLGEKLVEQIENVWQQTHPEWTRKRLLVVRLVAQQNHSVAGIMNIARVSRQSVFNYRDKLVEEGPEELLKRDWAGGRKLIHRLGGKLRMPRKSHRRKDQAASDAFRAELPELSPKGLAEIPTNPCACGSVPSAATGCCQ